jgi:hypothetical protein
MIAGTRFATPNDLERVVHHDRSRAATTTINADEESHSL